MMLRMSNRCIPLRKQWNRSKGRGCNELLMNQIIPWDMNEMQLVRLGTNVDVSTPYRSTGVMGANNKKVKHNERLAL